MFVSEIKEYYDLNGHLVQIHPDFGYWLEDTGQHYRFCTDTEESVWVEFDDYSGDAFEVARD